MEINEQIENIKKIISDPNKIVISRIPSKTKEMFKDFAYSEFMGDYGMALKHLLDFYIGLIPKGWEHLEYEIENIKGQIEELKSKVVEKKEEKVIRSVSGQRIGGQ